VTPEDVESNPKVPNKMTWPPHPPPPPRLIIIFRGKWWLWLLLGVEYCIDLPTAMKDFNVSTRKMDNKKEKMNEDVKRWMCAGNDAI